MNACAHHGYLYQHCAKNPIYRPQRQRPSSFESGPCLIFSRGNLCRLLVASMLQVPKPIDVLHSILQLRAKEPTMCLLFIFSTIQLTVGLCCRGVQGACGAFERRHAAHAVVGRLGLVLDTEFGFWASRRRNRAPPLKPPWFFEQETATGNRISISVFLRAKKVAVSKTAEKLGPKSYEL